MVFGKLVTVVTWPACGSWFSESVSQGVLAPSVLQSWSIIIWLPPSKQFVFSTAKRVLPRWSSPWLLGMVNMRPSDRFWDLLLLREWMSSAFLPLLLFFCYLSLCAVPKLPKVIQVPSLRVHPSDFAFRVTLWLEERPIYMIKPSYFLSIYQARCRL